ncbi:MAG: hypothetical protein GY953_41090, partial [bacterium]|nr:hypothetical protein [bacterium]
EEDEEEELTHDGDDGGEAITVCEYAKGSYRGATWSSDGDRIAFVSGGKIIESPAGGGTPVALFDGYDPQDPVGGIWWPHFLPDTAGPEALVFPAGNQAESKFWALNLETGEHHELRTSGAISAGKQARYSHSGHLIYQASINPETGLWAVPFDRQTLKTAGEAFRIEQTG